MLPLLVLKWNSQRNASEDFLAQTVAAMGEAVCWKIVRDARNSWPKMLNHREHHWVDQHSRGMANWRTDCHTHCSPAANCIRSIIAAKRALRLTSCSFNSPAIDCPPRGQVPAVSHNLCD